jgi:hypothetical protein
LGVDDRGVVRRFVGIRVAFWIGAAVALIWSPIRNKADIPPFHAWFGLGDHLFDTFAQWDSGWFIGIAHDGYRSKQTAAFFPLYPLLIRGDAEIVGGVLRRQAAPEAGLTHRLCRLGGIGSA